MKLLGDDILGYEMQILYLCIMWLPSRKWNAWNSIQWLQQKTEWIVIDNNNSAWIP